MKLALIVFLMTSFYLNAQVGNDLVYGKQYSIDSNILKSKRNIYISLPESYEISKEKYPVVYILDGQIHFMNGVAIQKSLKSPRDLPEMIIVGLENVYPGRKDLTWANKDDYLSMLGLWDISLKG